MSEVIARGRIKVDARKALDKLRDHMLVDPHLWACEIGRVAVALGASAIDADWDASSIAFAFDGRALDPAQIARARDHVLTPLEGTDGDALRALGIAIGAALSLDPAFIEVTAAGMRVRFERSYIADETVAPNPELAEDGATDGRTRVLFKRPLGFGSLSRAFSAEIPAEVTLLRGALSAPGVALRIRGQPVQPEEPPVLTVDLDVPGTTRAVLEVLRRPIVPQTHFHAYGVRLSSYALRGCWGLAVDERTRLPLRVVVDAPDLPTNASRSQVRTDSELVQRVFAHIVPAFAVAVATLRAGRAEKSASFGHTVSVHAEPGVLRDVFGAIAAEAAIATRLGSTLEPDGAALLDEKVLYDALGRAISLAEVNGGTPEMPVRIYEGDSALEEDLAPWFQHVVWRRGLAAERALEGLATMNAQELLVPALAARDRRARALQHPPSPPTVALPPQATWKESFSVSSGDFAGLAGEVAVGAVGTVATARVFVDERALETVTLPGVRLPVALAIGWPGRIVARFEYDAVERNEALGRALQYALRVAAMAIATHNADPELARLAQTTWGETSRALGDKMPVGLLGEIPSWRTNDGKLTTLKAINAYARKTGAVCHASTSKPAPDGRLVVASWEVPALRELLPKKTEFVAYDRALGVPPGQSETPPSVVVLVHQPSIEGFITPSPDAVSRLRVYHAGETIRRESWKHRNGPVEVVLVDYAAVPGPTGKPPIWSSPLASLDKEEDALVEAVTSACESESIDLSTVERYLELALASLVDRRRPGDPSRDKNDAADLVARIAELPARRERARQAQRRDAILAQPAFDLAPLVGARIRGVATSPGKGGVTVVLGSGPTQLLFAGHAFARAPAPVLPVEAFVDVVDESFVDDWERLSGAGTVWAESAIVDAALSLVERLVELDSFVDLQDALALLAALLVESPARAAVHLQRVRWPTVQGTTITLGDAARVNKGNDRYEPWRTGDPSPYDAPAIHLPPTRAGALRHKVLSAGGIELTDVTEATARLQALRARGARGAPPRLDGAPAHPLLRASLGQLGATSVEGEIELVDGAASFQFVNPSGVAETLYLDIGCPVRVIYRAEPNNAQSDVRELAAATRALLLRLRPALGGLPPFVRRRVRSVLLADIARGATPSNEELALPVFEATDDTWHSLAELPATTPFTIDPPPHPPLDDLTLRLGDAEANALSKLTQLRDVTFILRKKLRGIEARSRPPLEAIALTPEKRAQCMFVVSVDEDGVQGEIGLLAPTHAAARRVEICVERRVLTSIADPEGWPVIAILNDDRIVADDSFTELADPKKETLRLHPLVRRVVAASLVSLLRAPADVLGTVRLPTPLVVRSPGQRDRSVTGAPRTVAALGVLWLPKEWPERPAVHVEGINVVDPDRLPILRTDAHSRVLPVAGKVWVSCDAAGLDRALDEVFSWVSLRLAAHVRAHSNVDKYRWDLALLGVLDEPAVDPVKELAQDRPDPDLLHVAARRAPHLIDRATGDAPTAPVHVQLARAEEAEPPSVLVEAQEGFFAGLVRRFTELFDPASVPVVESALTEAIGHALDGMQLTGKPVMVVRESRRGRPVTYDKARKTILVNAQHAVVQKLAASPNGVLHLVLAALSEVNRELAEVTDAEEMAKVYDVLRANGDPAASS